MLLHLVKNDGLQVKKETVKECSSPCPGCAGDDRFRIFTDTGRYWCRQCGKSGDAIQYLRDFHGMSFRDAAEAVGQDISERPQVNQQLSKPAKKEQSKLWQQSADKLITQACDELKANSQTLSFLQSERGITITTAEKFCLGWIDRNIYQQKEKWGMVPNAKQLFIPSGLVIPWKDRRIRIRRNNPGDYGRYYVLQGSNPEPYTIGHHYENTAIIVESELDAILLSQEMAREVFIVALGSSTTKPDELLLEKLAFCPVILVVLDTDEAGAKASRWWLENIPNSYRTLIPRRFGKDPSEAHINGLNLNEWLSASLELYCDEVLETQPVCVQ